MSTIVDSNIFIDLMSPDTAWYGWSTRMLRAMRARGELVVNPVVLAEVSASLAREDEIDEAMPVAIYRRENLPWEAAWPAARAFVDYRRRGGERRSPLPDFFVGAHALVAGHAVLTRDPRRYRAYFPEVDVIAPDTHP